MKDSRKTCKRARSGFALNSLAALAILLAAPVYTATSGQQPPSDHPQPAGSAAKPLTAKQIQGLIAGGVDSRRLALLVDSRGIDFVPSPQFLNDLKSAGVSDVLIQALTNARPVEAGAPKSAPEKPAPPAARPPAPSRRAAPMTTARSSPSVPTAGGTSGLSPALERGLEQDMARAADFNRLQSWERAEEIYRATLRVNPGIPAAHVGLGTALIGEKRWDDAIVEYREVLRLDPKNQIAHRELAHAFTEKRDWDNAVIQYGVALEQEPSDVELESGYGRALYARGDLGKAVGAYQAAKKLKPDDASIEKALALALYASGDTDGALAAFREAARLDPNDPEVHKSVGDVLLDKGDRRGALEEYHRAFELAPDDSTMGASYAAILKKLGTGAEQSVAGKTQGPATP